MAPGDSLRLWDLPIGPQVPGPSMYFPTAMTWCVGTTSSSVATMTRRSGSGTAGDIGTDCVRRRLLEVSFLSLDVAGRVMEVWLSDWHSQWVASAGHGF